MFWRIGKECSNHKYVVIIGILICQNIWLNTKNIFLCPLVQQYGILHLKKPEIWWPSWIFANLQYF